MNSREATQQAERVTPARPVLHEPINLPRVLRSLKILDRHLDLIVIVYVRQSDPQQVLNHRESRERQYRGHSYGIKFQGTEGQLLVDRNTFDILPESLGLPRYIGEPERSWAHPPHHNNFFESVKSRKPPAAEIEQGHRSTTPLLLAGIALKTRRKLNWDSETETFIGDEAANRYLSRAYRAPWHL